MATPKFKRKSATQREAEGLPSEDKPPLGNRPLHVLYRPKELKQLVGQEHVVSSLGKLLKARTCPHAFLFTGPSGTGKTTVARIVAHHLGIDNQGLIEIDAASNSGIEHMRQLLEMVRYTSLNASGRKFVIVDEAHALSKATWQSLLKPIEEPPAHVYWAFCTTEDDKIPATIKTRCTSYNLKPMSEEQIEQVLGTVIEAEEIEIDEKVLSLIVSKADGSARRALVFLSQVAGVSDRKEAARLIENGVGEEAQAIALARMICTGKGFSWENAVKVIKSLDGDSPEGVRLMVVNYAAKMLENSRDPQALLAVLEAFRTPCNSSEKWAPIYLAVGELLYS